MLGLSNQNLETDFIKILQQVTINTLKTNKKIESLSKKVRDIKKNKMENLELKKHTSCENTHQMD